MVFTTREELNFELELVLVRVTATTPATKKVISGSVFVLACYYGE